MAQGRSLATWVPIGLLLEAALPACSAKGASSDPTRDMGGADSTQRTSGGVGAKGVGGTTVGSGTESATLSGNGGTPSTGNSSAARIVGGALNSATGGTAAGGSVATSRVSNSGASAGAGGVAAGGKSSIASTVSVGGRLSIGGTPSSSGGWNAGGGSIATGGVAANGGTSTLGGKPATGGRAISGGSTFTGGAPASGGVAVSGTTGTTVTAGVPETIATGYGKSTTGGGSIAPRECASLAALQQAVDGYTGTGGLVLKYIGKFDFASIPNPCTQHGLDSQVLEIKNTSNVSILGADGSSSNFGIRIVGASSNIIVRNMTIGLTPGGDSSDMISIEGNSTGAPSNVWIDHNTLFSSMVECDGAGDTEFDGMIDIKKGADNITVSYNYMHDHHKVSLNGHSDDTPTNQHVTFHHNLFENVGSRTPLQRFGFTHIFNNYFFKITVSAINVRMGGYSLVEANYFETVANPVTSRDSAEIGYWELRANNLSTAADVSTGNRFGITWTAGDSGTVNATNWATTKAYPIALGYTYAAQPYQCVHDGIRAVVGAGKGLATLVCK